MKVATVVALAILGWALAQALGRGIAPALFRRMDPATAGTVGFLIRLTTIVARRRGGAAGWRALRTSTLAVGGAVTAVVLGLAAQQTLGNLFAGLVLLSTRPFRVGDRVRLIGGALGRTAGGNRQLARALLHHPGQRSRPDHGPERVVLNLAVMPLREPERVELRARFSADTTPSEVQEMLEGAISVPTRYAPHIALEELDRDEVVVRIVATPTNPADGAKLAGEILAAIRQTDGTQPQTTDEGGRPSGCMPVDVLNCGQSISPRSLAGERDWLSSRLARVALQLGDQQLRVQRGDQVVQRLGAGLDQLDRAVGVEVAGEPLGQHLDLLGDQRLQRLLVAQRVVDGEPEPLVVAAGPEAADRLDDPDVGRASSRARRGSARSSSASRSRTSLRDLVAARGPPSAGIRSRSPASARSRIRSSSSIIARRRSGSASSRSSSSRITRSGMKRSSWSCLISRIRSTNSGG